MEKRGLLLITTICLISLLAASPLVVCAQEKPIKLKWASHMPDTNRIQKYGVVGFGTQIEEATKGRIKIDYYSGQSLCKGKDIYDTVKNGLADVGHVVSLYTPGRFPMLELFMLYMGLPNGELSSRIIWELYEEFPEAFKKELGDVKVLAIEASEPAHIGSRKPIRSPEDVVGLKIRAYGVAGQFFKALGAIPISAPVVESYTTMEQGIVDAYCTTLHVTGDYRLWEVTDCFTDLNVYCPIFMDVMNLDKWNSLPPDIQKQMMSVCGLKGSMHFGRVNDKAGNETLEKLKKMPGKTMITPTAKDQEAFMSAAESIRNEYVAKLEAKGLPGKAYYNEALRLIKKYSK